MTTAPSDNQFAYPRELTRYSVAASVAVLYYDYILTFNSEYNLFWKNFQFSWISLLYFLNRYMALVAHVFIVIEFFCDLPIQLQSYQLSEHMHSIIKTVLSGSSSSVSSYVVSLSPA
ncbi:hypothetical protein QCA50_013815 [Cerrena zonata]|uniref:DUF6533 domain-containing protein n=1 Tax=Cerrena zonata TaxID=2478898 RepID=A0AAW0G0Q4_9APHY